MEKITRLILLLLSISNPAAYSFQIHQYDVFSGLSSSKLTCANIAPASKSHIKSAPSNLCRTPTTHLHALPKQNQNQNQNDDDASFYNDDAFGLIFLTGLLYLRDTNFATIFGVLSAVAASGSYFGVFDGVSVSSNSNNHVRVLLPGIVALLSWIVRAAVVGGGLGDADLKVEFIVCLVSFLWSVVQFSLKSRDNATK